MPADNILRGKVYGSTMRHMKPKPSENGDSRSIERELKRGSLELIVLHLLSRGEAYGYEIVTKLSDRTQGGSAACLSTATAR